MTAELEKLSYSSSELRLSTILNRKQKGIEGVVRTRNKKASEALVKLCDLSSSSAEIDLGEDSQTSSSEETRSAEKMSRPIYPEMMPLTESKALSCQTSVKTISHRHDQNLMEAILQDTGAQRGDSNMVELHMEVLMGEGKDLGIQIQNPGAQEHLSSLPNSITSQTGHKIRLEQEHLKSIDR
ncbi:hypothetical protein STEG23_026951 [Scotinomys teguina]